MYDMHYDLLTILYYYCKSHKNFDYLSDYLELLPKIYNEQNIKGGIINFYFDTVKEMQTLDIGKSELINMKTTFIQSIKLVENMKILSIIPEDTDFLYGIEGCDFLENENDLEELYRNGLRAVTPFYKYKSKYGSGYLASGGLTLDGYKLIHKIVDLNIITDISHANDETYDDILNAIKSLQKEGYNPIIIASHSNIRDLCQRPRNLTKEQLLKLKECGGYISLFTNGNFVSLNNEQINYQARTKNFLRHLNYLIYEIQYDPSKILIASDDMNFHPDKSYHHLEVFPLETINSQITKLLTENYGDEIAKQITYKNAYQLFRKIKKDVKSY